MSDHDEFLWFASLELEGDLEQREKIPTNKKKTEKKPKLSFSLNLNEELESYHQLQGTESSFCPYNNPYPSFKDMNQEQKDFYLFWRDQVRQGWFHFTDMGYIHVLTFEYLHGFGWDTPQEGGDKLIALWQAYGNLDKTLNKHFINWILDFFLLNNLDLTPFLQLCTPSDFSEEQLNLCYHSYSTKSPYQLPFLLLVATYPNTDIWAELHLKNLLDEVKIILEHTFCLCDDKMQRVKNKSIHTLYASKQKVTYSRFAYDKIPYISKKPSFHFEVTDHLNYNKLLLFLENFIDFTLYTLNELWETDLEPQDATLGNGLEEEIELFLKETCPHPKHLSKPLPKSKPDKKGFSNLCFKKSDSLYTPSRGRFKPQTKEIEDTKETQEPKNSKPLIDEKKLELLRKEAENLEITLDFTKHVTDLPTPPPLNFAEAQKEKQAKKLQKEAPKPLELDFSTISKLREESDAVRKSLAVEEPSPQPPPTPVSPSPPPDSTPPDSAPPDSTPSDSTLPNQYQGFWTACDPIQKQTLTLIAKKDWQALAQLALEQFSMIELLVDQVNALATEELGDILLETTNPEEPEFLEEYHIFYEIFNHEHNS